jgi:hypothetical protein
MTMRFTSSLLALACASGHASQPPRCLPIAAPPETVGVPLVPDAHARLYLAQLGLTS